MEWVSPKHQVRRVGQFRAAAKDPVIGIATVNALRNIALAVFVQVPVGLVLGYVLSRRVRGARAFLFFFFLPVIVSEATLALMWRSIYQADIGPLNGLLNAAGLEQLIRPWLSSDGIVQWTVLIPGTWAWVGLNVVLFLTAVHGISRDLLDAATVDGATPVQEFRYVVAPNIRRVYVAATMLAIAGAVSPFLYPRSSTQGGPLDMTQSFMTYAWQQVFPLGNGRPEWGYGSDDRRPPFWPCDRSHRDLCGASGGAVSRSASDREAGDVTTVNATESRAILADAPYSCALVPRPARLGRPWISIQSSGPF